MYNQDQRDRFYQAYVQILRRAPQDLQEKWDELIAWIEGHRHPYPHCNTALLPEPLKGELNQLIDRLKQGAI